MSEETPPDPVHAIRRPPGDAPGVDMAWMWEFRREVSKLVSDARRESNEAMADLRSRLGGIEGQLSDGANTIEKHGDQLTELIDQAHEQETRLRKLEAEGGSALVRRVVIVEKTLEDIHDDAIKVRAATEALAHQSRNSLGKRLGTAFMVSMAAAVGPVAVGVVLWAIVTWVKHGAPGSGLP